MYPTDLHEPPRRKLLATGDPGADSEPAGTTPTLIPSSSCSSSPSGFGCSTPRYVDDESLLAEWCLTLVAKLAICLTSVKFCDTGLQIFHFNSNIGVRSHFIDSLFVCESRKMTLKSLNRLNSFVDLPIGVLPPVSLLGLHHARRRRRQGLCRLVPSLRPLVVGVPRLEQILNLPRPPDFGALFLIVDSLDSLLHLQGFKETKFKELSPCTSVHISELELN